MVIYIYHVCESGKYESTRACVVYVKDKKKLTIDHLTLQENSVPTLSHGSGWYTPSIPLPIVLATS